MEDRKSLREIIHFFYALESSADLTSTPGDDDPTLSTESPHTENIARILGYSSSAELLEIYGEFAERNRQFLESIRIA